MGTAMDMWRIAALGALALSLFWRPAGADETVLRYGQIPSTMRSVSALHLFVAEREGLFAQQGLRVERVPIAGGTDKMVAALAAGTVDVAQSATPYLITAVMAGSDAVAIAGENANPVYSLIAKPEIKDFADLKGRLVGLSLAVDTISISTRKLMALHGLGPGDIRVKELVGTPARFDCLKSGECDAVPLGQPEDFIAIDAGYRRLGVSSDAVAAFKFQILATRRPWAEAHEDTVVRFVRALAASFRFIRDPAHRDEVAGIVVAATGASDAIARRVLALYLDPDRGVLPRAAEIDLKGLAQVIAFMGEAGVLKAPLPAPEQFVDLRYLHNAGID
ncbi:MAG TPA: ABC transporter substrate-binding protein [Stellaceae bacterium]|nr:ABC transporter substrate-binding protein [Stellaceae bacterium]